jgi:hypothetical protein
MIYLDRGGHYWARTKKVLRLLRAWLAVELRPDAPGDPGADV